MLLGALVICAGAPAVSGASGSPRWFYCAKAVPKDTGAYADRDCSVPGSPAGSGKYELLEGVGTGRTLTVKGGASEEVTVVPPCADCEGIDEAKLTVKCRSLKGSGHPVAPGGVAGLVLTFSKCAALGTPCQSGDAKGEIVTEPLAGQLGWLEGSRVGVDLANQAAPDAGGVARFTCPGLGSFTLLGSVIGEQTGDTEGVSKELHWRWSVGPYLGEVETPTGRYTPLIDTPSFVGGPDDYLVTRSETTEGSEEGEPPSGLTAEATGKGEALEASG